jgi:glycosyltransferase involved in cell wall biosynthesis
MSNQRPKPVLTVSIPTWNRAEYLRDAIDTLAADIAQHGLEREVEIFVSDNGSEDGTQAVVEERMALHSYVRYVRNERNLGVRFNVLQSMRMAEGEYCMFLGDDDRLVAGSLSAIVNRLRANRDLPALFIQQAGDNNMFRDIAADTFLSFADICDRYFYDIGNAGIFIVGTERARAAIAKYGVEFFSNTWPQTQVVCLSLAGETRPCLISPIKAVNSDLHNTLTVYSGLYIWRTAFADLLVAARDMAPMIGRSLWEKVGQSLSLRLKSLVTEVQFYGAFLDTQEQRRETAASIRGVLGLLPWKARVTASLLWATFMLPQPQAAALYRARVRLRHGDAGLKSLDSQVQEEVDKRKLARRGLSVRESV